MAVADIELDMEFMEALDFLSAIPCDLECEKEAEWKYITRCCGSMIVLCNPHHEKVIVKLHKETRPTYCEVCKHLGLLKDMFLSIERL